MGTRMDPRRRSRSETPARSRGFARRSTAVGYLAHSYSLNVSPQATIRRNLMQSTTHVPALRPIRFGLRIQFMLALALLVVLSLGVAGAAIWGLTTIRTSVQQGVEIDGR